MRYERTLTRTLLLRSALLVQLLIVWPSISDAADLAGCWEGTWNSCSTGHKGVLRAKITPCSDGVHYRADFEGTFFKFLPFQYSVVLTVTQPGDPVEFQGQQDLGRLAGGVYRYTGYATDCEFHANYGASKDHGKFVMRRVSCCNCCQCRD